MEMKIDKERREHVRKLHTATHILNYSSKKILGNHIWQNGSSIRENFATLDITHYKNITIEEKIKIENLANKIVFLGKSVYINEIDRNKAEKEYGYTIYQGGAVPTKKIRIVKIEDYDIEACGGLHVKNTNEIGIIKIFKIEKVQDGLIRLYFKVHKKALSEINELDKVIEELKEFYKVPKESIIKNSKKFFENWKTAEKEKKELKETLIKTYKNVLKSNEELIVDNNLNLNDLLEIVNNKELKNVVVKNNNFIVTNKDEEIIKNYKKILNKNGYKIYIL